ncbi:MAG: glycosyltransferase family 39 protein [Acidobacteriota bacterium]|nr:glycosyltransferase family 39 protein [Acidobacteriota bacterium]
MPADGRVDRSAPAGTLPLWRLYPLFFAAIYLSHLTLLRLPYYWDEAGYYLPAAWDFFRTGSLIPQSTLTNAHPPLPSVLLAAWWHLYGFVPSGTRTLVCLVAAAALLAVYRIGCRVATPAVAAVTTLLTALYPIWFAQSTLAHADIFAAAFTLWALAGYLPQQEPLPPTPRELTTVATLFALAALSKETAIVTPAGLAALHLAQMLRGNAQRRTVHLRWVIALAAPVFPLAAWYAYHHAHTGFYFGNPQFLRYNATANLDPLRVLLSLWHRALHLTAHMNLFVATGCAALAVTRPSVRAAVVSRSARTQLLLVVAIHWIAFSVLGGALLTRYLLAAYPLVLLLCVAAWHQHLRRWWLPALLTATAFVAGLWLNPPYSFAPEDNLTYRDMVVLHQQAVERLTHQFPGATVLTAWPASSELTRPELGYLQHPVAVTPVQDFQPQTLATLPATTAYDTVLLFSMKWSPAPGALNLGHANEANDVRYFDFHHDATPDQAAQLLHATVVWQAQRHGEWVAILRKDAQPSAGNAAGSALR